MNKFYAKFGGIETTIAWDRPTDDSIRRWRDDLSFDLTDWFVVGNVIEKYSPTWDVDLIYIKPETPHLSSLSEVFSEMIGKGFTHKLLIDCAWMPEFYQDEWMPIKKIRPDVGFEKFWNGKWYRSQYTADVVKQIGEQLWYYEWNSPHPNWKKGKERNYNFTGISLNKF
jgi:hypothetical protein